MNSKQIKSFLCVAECLNFTEAGKRLYSSQTTVSRQISSLEEELGFKLLVRGNNYVSLTPAGSVILETFQKANGTIQEGIERAKHVELGIEGTVNIGFFTLVNIRDNLFEPIKRFQKNYPKVKLQFSCFEDQNYDYFLNNDNIDITFNHDFSMPKGTDVVSGKVVPIRTYMYIGLEHRLAQKENLTPADFEGEDIWVLSDYNTEACKRNVRNFFQYYGVTKWKIRLTNNWNTALINTQMGYGAFFGDSLVVPYEGNLFRKIELPEELSMNYIMASWKKSNLTPALSLFVNEIVEELV
jgi:DNA-binding transcriptional LysR family regulator